MLPWKLSSVAKTRQCTNDESIRLITYPSFSLSRVTLLAFGFLVSLFLVILRFSSNVPPLISSSSSSSSPPPPPSTTTPPASSEPDPCAGRYIYVHSLPTRFNTDMLSNCSFLNIHVPMCNFILNNGFGLPLTNISDGAHGETGWYWTNQFTLEMIFHERFNHYECLTSNSSQASAIFIPYYAGFDFSRYIWTNNLTLRDSGPKAFMNWVKSQPEWNTMDGRDHFLVAGRITWEFRRTTNQPGDWGNNLFLLPGFSNMTTLTIEATWGTDGFDRGIPYPTEFHPSTLNEIHRWQDFLRQTPRPYLFSFIGAPRSFLSDSIRDELINQCSNSLSCGLVTCGYGPQSCDLPWVPMRTLQQSVFCLQPPGDSPTRRSTFEGILAGCIPVFFHRASAYDQYRWHLPAADEGSYSVFIDAEEVKSGKVSVEERLRRFGKEEVDAMRETVLGLIPKILYAHPMAARTKGFQDAFDITVSAVLDRIQGLREEVEQKQVPGGTS